jgi:DNA-binding transcriptional regulator LsrR (DeoR family)
MTVYPQSDTTARRYSVYVCDACGSITDAHGEPVGCVDTACDAPTMRPTEVVEVNPRV